ncbi:ABC transporter substrate-binding protein [Nostoc sp. DedQUE07]|uniref:ABC transporter substrate-binding protein n=1 Tax=Nostoc sp. DedQUE07 TaxID=3075392 RepID=UPI002AD31731|nr:ABC transporter substrate-binding protein [Nostoc sp. DedQUE07]MDZ8128134.1 ABC transporter substrate-binding protein [Nostoc sp. DedQUE07]
MNGANGRRNPYIIGRPIHERSKFFGRQSLFDFIEDNLSQGVRVILLHGQRRIGKSSVLKQIPNFVQLDKFIFIQFDLQDKGNLSLSDILYDLAVKITEIVNDKSILPQRELLKEESIFSEVFLPQVFQKIENKNLVLLLDEFDVVNDEFFPYLSSLINKDKINLFVIPVIGRYLHDLPNLLSLFKSAPSELIGFLDDTSAKRMIANPAEGILTYQAAAIQKILQLSAGHPCFTQVICSTLFEQARENNKWSIERADVESILTKAIEKADFLLQNFWDVLTVEERIIMSAVAEAEKIAIGQGKRVPEDPLNLLSKNGINQTEQLSQAWERLIEIRYLSGSGRTITVELIRCWLLQYHSLQNEIQALKIQELQTLESENVKDIVNNLVEVANFWSEQGQYQLALQHYEQALERDPNSFNIKVSLAEQYLKVRDFEKSLECHRELYQVDPENFQIRYLDALSAYGHYLIIQRKYKLAKKQYNEILKIEFNRKSAKERLLEIEIYETTRGIFRRPPRIPRGITLVGILAGITIFGIVFYVANSLSSGCSPGQQKEFILFCIEDKNIVSNGDRTFFPNVKNIARDQGIQAFKKQYYKEAIKLFQQAVAANRNDPELLIYYNNALAHDRGNPIALAVAVPADNNTNFAQEILRGVSQAQHQFNNGFNNGKKGLNGRLLEIKIANDAGQPEQAQKVAAELIKDNSILGVIGHYSSDSTKTALQEYNKTDIAIISPSSTSTKLQGQNFFRSLPSDAAGGKKLAEYAFKKLNLRKVVIFSNPDSPYSESMREEFQHNFEQRGGKVLRKPEINLANTSLDINAEVNRSIYRYKAEAAVLIPDARHADIALKIAKANQEALDRPPSQNGARAGMKLLGGDILYSDETLSRGRNAVEGLITVVPWFREAPQAQIFAQKAFNQWGGGVSWRTATSYDATQAFIQALTANSDRTTVIENLRSVNLSQENTSGDPLQFNSEGERQTEPILVQVQGGRWVMLHMLQQPEQKQRMIIQQQEQNQPK